MYFTSGSDRAFEQLMQGKPGFDHYLLFVYLFGKLGQAYRLAEGIDLSQKLLHFADGCAAAFESAAPSFHPIDLLIGVAGAAALRLMVYCKGKNAKKYRKGVEYGSARWSA